MAVFQNAYMTCVQRMKKSEIKKKVYLVSFSLRFFRLKASLGEKLCVVFLRILYTHSYFCQEGRKEVRAK